MATTTPNPPLDRLRQDLERLDLSRIAEIFQIEAEKAAGSKAGYTEYLANLVAEELRSRDHQGVQRRIKASAMPLIRTLEQFDFAFQPTLDERRVKELFTLAFVEHKEPVWFIGPPGVGKTHLSLSLCLRACERGYTTRFVRASDMVDDLFASLSNGSLKRRMRRYIKPALLAIDEVGTERFDARRAHLFFEVIAKRHGLGATIITSNKNLDEWSEVLAGDAALAAACLDRLLEGAHVFQINGPSYRTKGKRAA